MGAAHFVLRKEGTMAIKRRSPEKPGASSPPAPGVQIEARPARPTEDEIRKRAHEIYLARNGAPGSCEGDWLQAERELMLRVKG